LRDPSPALRRPTSRPEEENLLDKAFVRGEFARKVKNPSSKGRGSTILRQPAKIFIIFEYSNSLGSEARSMLDLPHHTGLTDSRCTNNGANEFLIRLLVGLPWLLESEEVARIIVLLYSFAPERSCSPGDRLVCRVRGRFVEALERNGEWRGGEKERLIRSSG
jgi:hypothetical protein